jgi:Tfp pilus assembly protein PilO
MNLKKEIVIISIILGIISLVFILVFITPLLKSIRNNPIELIKVKKELSSFQEVTDKTGEIKSIYEEINPNLEKINQLFAKLETPIDLIKFFQKTAKDTSLVIKIVPVSSEKGFDDYWDNSTFRLTLIGSYNDFMKFLEKIENGPYLTEDQELSIRKATSSEMILDEDIKADLTIKVFVK